jgi:hypothetical protein|tara:strand:+ start:109 stop:654 length:546 start_codon:yes stop_codon:yes gene_type:complete
MKVKKKDRTHLRVTTETKAALDKHQKDTGSKSANDAIANLLGTDVSKPKAKKPKIYKEHNGVPAAIIDVEILRCWSGEQIRDKTRAEIIHSFRDALERPYPNGKTWASLYPRWHKKSLDDYVNDRLQSLKKRGFIDTVTKGVWTMSWTTITTEEVLFLRLVTEYIEPSKQLNIPQLLRDRE